MKVLSYYNLPKHQNIIFLCKTHPIVDTVPVVVEHVHAVGLQGGGRGGVASILHSSDTPPDTPVGGGRRRLVSRVSSLYREAGR